MAYTGGFLNELNGKYGISAPDRSVPVMKLIQIHKPGSREELCDLIKYHHENDCPCGIKSHGTVEDFGKRLYKAQLAEWGRYRYTLDECLQWEYDLFIVQSMKGTMAEQAALESLSKILSCVDLTVSKTTGFEDEALRVDLVVMKNGIPVCGVQVKPLSFNKMRKGVISFNKSANAKWGKPVFYLLYDETGVFTNMDDVAACILDFC